MSITKDVFGKTPAGETVDLYTLTNANGMVARVMNYGATITSLVVPDRNGRKDDVVLGFPELRGYTERVSYQGCTCGRYANRIAKGTFTLGGATYKLATNNGPNHLHGGLRGFNAMVWQAQQSLDKEGPAVAMTYLSKDGEEGYPGNLSVKVVFTLTDRNAIKIDYFANTDKDTVLNLTNHAFFNLTGCQRDILDHVLTIKADRFTVVDNTAIPSGELREVKGTPMDFTKPCAIGARINDPYEQLVFGNGYDHNYVLGAGGALSLAAELYDPASGRVMETLTTEPGVQLYTGNFLDGSQVGKGNVRHQKRWGLCLETQHFPDSPNQPTFPTTVLKPGQIYRQTTVYKFSTR